jgi:hypothetical protein
VTNATTLEWTPGWEGNPLVMSLDVSDADLTNPRILVPYNYSGAWFTPSRQLTQKELEFWQFGQFCIDYFVATGRDFCPFGARASEHPDFLVSRAPDWSDTAGVELAAYVPGQRLAIESALSPLREIVRSKPADFQHLRDCLVWVMFGDPEHPEELPRLRSTLTTEAANGLRQLSRPEIRLGDFAASGLPEHFPPGAFSTLEQRGINFSAHRPGGSFEEVDTGPVVNPMFQLRQSAEEIKTELVRIVDSHNYPGVDLLVVPIGGPTRDGALCTEGSVLLEYALRSSEDTASWFQGRKGEVVAHSWTNGSITQLYPTKQQLTPPLVVPNLRRRTLVVYESENGALLCQEGSVPMARLLAD